VDMLSFVSAGLTKTEGEEMQAFETIITTKWYEACAEFPTSEEADAVLASLPKMLRAWKHEGTAYLADGNSRRYYAVTVRGDLRAKKGNERNEAGVKRLLRLIATVPVQYVTKYSDQQPTLADALAEHC
jgi:hypothetical protein